MNSALKAALFGLLAGSALLVGALLGLYLRIKRELLAIIMAFGAGVLICALSFDLMEKAYSKGGFDSVTIGFIAGALFYVLGNIIVNRSGGHYRKETLSKRHLTKNPDQTSDSGIAIFIGALLDGIPESAIIGVGLIEGKGFGALLLAAVFLSNLPEGISGANCMTRIGRSKLHVLGMWFSVAIACSISSVMGNLLLRRSQADLIAFILALAAGAMLAMISATMIPEAFDDEGRITPYATPLATVFGFLVAFLLSRLTR